MSPAEIAALDAHLFDPLRGTCALVYWEFDGNERDNMFAGVADEIRILDAKPDGTLVVVQLRPWPDGYKDNVQVYFVREWGIYSGTLLLTLTDNHRAVRLYPLGEGHRSTESDFVVYEQWRSFQEEKARRPDYWRKTRDAQWDAIRRALDLL
jgi:hypothetical protein